MLYILIGCLCFIAVHLFDYLSMKKVPQVKIFVWVVANGLIIYSIIRLWLSPDKLNLPVWTLWLGWLLFLVSAPLFLYSLYFNLPFRKTYIKTEANRELITTGLYALVRHPGLHMLLLLLIAVVLVSRSLLLLLATPIWIFLDLVLILIEDNYFFRRMFPGYDEYRKQTPLLLPSRKSFRAFMASFHTKKQK